MPNGILPSGHDYNLSHPVIDYGTLLLLRYSVVFLAIDYEDALAVSILR